MIDIEKCKIKIKLYAEESHIKAFVSFIAGGVRLGGFLIKDGQHGLYLDAPQISRKYIYFDENKSRWNRVQSSAVEEYGKLAENASMDDIHKPDPEDENEEINLDDVPF